MDLFESRARKVVRERQNRERERETSRSDSIYPRERIAQHRKSRRERKRIKTNEF